MYTKMHIFMLKILIQLHKYKTVSRKNFFGEAAVSVTSTIIYTGATTSARAPSMKWWTRRAAG